MAVFFEIALASYVHLNINYDPNPGQTEFHSSNAPYKAMVGALGSGKSSALCVEGFTLSLEYPGNVGLVARKSIPDLRMTTMKRFLEYVPEGLVISWNKVERTLLLKTSGKPSTVYFGPLDEIGRYKSLELGWFAIDEGDENSNDDHWLTLCGRLRLKDMPLYGLLATNPPSPQHWIYKKWVLDNNPEYALFRSKTSDNLANLPPGYIERLRKTYPEDWQKRYLDGEFGVLQTGDPVFPDFTAKHIKAISLIKGRDMIRGWDFGRRRPCVVFCQFDDMGRFRVYRTVLGENEDIYAFRDRIIKLSNQVYPSANFVDYCDPAGKQERDSGKPSILILNERGIRPKFRYSTPTQRATEMRRLMRETIKGESAFLIDPINQYLIEAFFGGCSMDESGNPRKDGYYEHGVDAVGYAIANTCMVKAGVQESEIEIQEPKWSLGGRR